MRTIERGRYLGRSANTGISGIVDPYGGVFVQSDLFESAILVEEVRLLSGLTVYGKVGDLFAHLRTVLDDCGDCCSFRVHPY